MAMFFDPYGSSSGTSAFGGSTSPSLYGGLLDDTQQEALRQRGLMGFLGGMQKAGSLDYVDPFSGVRIGGLAGGLAGGAQGMLNAQDQGVINALNAQKLGLEGQQLQFKVGGVKALMPALQKLIDQMGGAPAGSPDTSGPQTAGPGGADTTIAPISADAGPLMTHLTQNLGYTPGQAAAVLGNAHIESGLQTSNPGDGGTSDGLFQWHADRLDNLKNYAESQGKPWTDPIVQLNFMDKELRSTTPEFFQEQNPMRAAQLFQDKFERPRDDTGLARGRAAMGILANYGGGGQAQAATGALQQPLSEADYQRQYPGGDLPAVPDFSGMMQGHAGAPYAPSAPPGLAGSGQPSASPGGRMNGGMAAALAAPGDSLQHLAVTHAYATALQNGFKGTIQDFVSQQAGGAQSPGATAGDNGQPFVNALRQRLLAQNGPPSAPAPPQAAPRPPMQAMPGTPTAFGIDPRAKALAAFGAMANLYGLGDVVKPVETMFYNSPGQAAAKAAAEGLAKAPYEDAYLRAALAAKLLPPGSPEQQLAQAHLSNLAGIKPILGGERPGVPIRKYNQATGQYDIVDYNPRVGEGQIFNGNEVQVIPKAPEAEQTMATARAAGPATFKAEEIPGPYGRENLTTALNLPNVLGAGGGVTAPTAVGGGMATGLNVAPPAAPQTPAAAGAISPWQAAVPVPVKTPQGVKDLSAVTVNDMFPGGQGIPRPPAPPPGMTYGKPSETESESQKHDAGLLEEYQKQTTGNQKIYQDLSHLSEVLQRGLNTNKLAPLWTDLTNVAQGMGLDGLIPKQYDPNDSAVFQKAGTDLVFAAVKKLAGQVKVAEIEGYKQANPNMTLPIAANVNIINDVLSNGKWEDARAKLASEYVTQTGGAPLSAFNARFNNMAPLVDVTNAYKGEFQKAGFKFPGDQTKDTMPAGATDKRVIGGTTYYKVGNQWFK